MSDISDEREEEKQKQFKIAAVFLKSLEKQAFNFVLTSWNMQSE